MDENSEEIVTTQKRSSKIPPKVPKKPKLSTPIRKTSLGNSSHQENRKNVQCDLNTLPNESETGAPVLRVSSEELLACNDLTSLPLLYDDVVLDCIVTRYFEDSFYTWAGPTLVAVNPCKTVDHIYSTKEIIKHHQEIKDGCDIRAPHVYSVAGVAHHRLSHQLGLTNQAILVSGESGSGKTESARYMLGYLTHVEKSLGVPRSPLKGVWKDHQPEDIKGRILASNPILEAFGNASTLRNYNSSRFGKLIRLQYGGAQLKGASIDTYLLEKTRITHQPANERNFHIFYQVLAGVQSSYLKDVGIESNSSFKIAPGSHNADDLEALENTTKAFQELRFSRQHQTQIIKVISALLHLGNLNFSQAPENKEHWTINRNDEGCEVSLKQACELLGLEEDKLIQALTIRTISLSTQRRVSVFHKPCERASQCEERRDALMQLLYSKLFEHIVSFINLQVSADKKLWSNFIGLLDVYGFETFENNSLEQLCINYVNERLQQEFIIRYLSTEHRVLREEGFIDLDVPYTDNTKCLSALDSHVSVFAILNEECQLKREVRESEACMRVCNALSDTGVVFPPSSPRHKPGFVVKHYAGHVKYDSKGLLHKNKDEVPHEVESLLGGSSCDFVSNMIIGISAEIEGDVGIKKQRKVTTLTKFKASLDGLLKNLTKCDLHYVRCIKPNDQGLPGLPEVEYVLHQLRSCGVIETIRISQAGYPVRIAYEDFLERYGTKDRKDRRDEVTRTKEIIVSALGALINGEVDVTKCRFGKTRLFLSESALHSLEEVRSGKRHQAATIIQKYVKGSIVRKQCKNMLRAAVIIQKNIRTWLQKSKYKKIRQSCIVIQKNTRCFISRKKYLKIQRSVLLIQKFARGMAARYKYENLLKQSSCSRPLSSYSLASYNSLGYGSMSMSTSMYGSMSASTSMYSLDTGAPINSSFLPLDAANFILSPSNQPRLETEESGIETDTESLHGAEKSGPTKKRTKVLRRRSQFHELMRSGGTRGRQLASTKSEGSSDDAIDQTTSSGVESNTSYRLDSIHKGGPRDQKRAPNSSLSKESTKLGVNPIKRTLKAEKESYHPGMVSIDCKVRVATMNNIEDMNKLIKGSSPFENLHMVLPRQNLSLFFKDGVLSYRCMPSVKIKFHTRRTCLAYSHNLPHLERPQGLMDAVH